jgi:hypothetical protein
LGEGDLMLRDDTYVMEGDRVVLLAANDANQSIWFCWPCGDAMCPECAQKAMDAGEDYATVEDLMWIETRSMPSDETCCDCGKLPGG